MISLTIVALKNISREKLSRIAFKFFKNISKWDDCVELMVDNNLSKVIYFFSKKNKVVENELKKNLKDETLKENLENIQEVLDINYRILSSYEKYVKEIRTDVLNWGPCHSEKFWKQNVKKFEDNNYELVK